MLWTPLLGAVPYASYAIVCTTFTRVLEAAKCGKMGVSQRIRTRRHPLTVGNASDPLPLLIDPVFLLLALAEGVHRGPCVQLSDVQHHALALQLELRVRLAFAA